MKGSLTVGQKSLVIVIFLCASIAGFMIKLPSVFRHTDKAMHTLFYFLAAAFFNFLLTRRNFLRHVAIFVSLYLFGVFIEYAQAWSNKIYHHRIHGRFDPADVASNLKGLLLYSLVWVLWCLGLFIYEKAKADRRRVSQ